MRGIGGCGYGEESPLKRYRRFFLEGSGDLMREGDLGRKAGAGRGERLSESDGDELPPSGDRKEMETGEGGAGFAR